MSTAVPLITLEDFLSLPEDGMDREVIAGDLRERPMTVRNQVRSTIQGEITQLLGPWAKRQPKPPGRVLCGEVGCILQRDPLTVVGVDVGFFSAEVLRNRSAGSTLVNGAPLLAIEILSPSDQVADIAEKVHEYLAAGVELVWVIDPFLQAVTVHRAGRKPQLVNVDEDLMADPVLPGLTVRVADLFVS